jgi:iron complex outermembrane receptor protein
MNEVIGRSATSAWLTWCRAIVIGIAFPCVTAAAADAESGSATASDSPAAAEQNSALAEIIVTARKREERLQDVPISMTAYTSKDIERYQTQTLQDVASLTPQLVINQSDNPTSTIFLRGIGASDNSPSIDQAVSINVDGVQVSKGGGIVRLGQLDIQRIEILKGPQSLFYGKDSPAGIISIVSADPGNSFESKIRAGYEIYNKQEFLEVMVSGPLNEVLGARLDAYVSNEKGWFVNEVPNEPGVTPPRSTTYPNQQQYLGRLTLLYTPSDVFDTKLKLSAGRVNQLNGQASGDEVYDCPTGAPQNAFGTFSPAGCRVGRYYSYGAISPEVAALDPHFGDGMPYLSSAQTLGSLTANYRPAKELTVTSVTGYFKDAEDESENFCRSVIACLPAFSYYSISQWTEELRARTSFDGPVNFLFGGFYQNMNMDVQEGIVFGVPIAPIPVLIEHWYSKEVTHSYSGFGQVIYDFAPLWELTGGARYTSESSSYALLRGPSGLNGFAALGPVPLAVPDVHFANVSPEATLNYRPTHDLTFYGAYRQGFVAGGYNAVSFQGPGANNSYRPETAKGGELGVKGRMFDGQVRFDADIYRYKYAQLQLSTFDPVTLSQPVINAGAATIEGIEASFVYAPIPLPQLSLRGSVAYNHNKYDDFLAQCYSGQTIVQGCNLNFAGGNYNSQNLGGAPLSHAPSWAAAAGASYEAPLNDHLMLTSSVDANYSSAFYGEVEEGPRSLQGQFWKLNMSITLHSDRGWEVALIGKNLTNRLTFTETYETNLTGQGYGKPGPILPSDMDAMLSPPRTLMLQFTLTNALFGK